MGTITFHPWPVRRGDVDRPDELRIDLDPQPGTTFADAARAAGVARELLEELGLVGWPKTSGNRGVHVYVRIEPRWEFADVRHAAIGFGRELEKRDEQVTTAWWKEERGERIFVDYNQNCRDRTIASRLLAARRCSARRCRRRSPGPSWPTSRPRGFDLFTVPAGSPSGDPWAGDRRRPGLDRAAAGALRGAGPVEMPYPPDHPKMPGEPPRVQPSKKVAAHWDEQGNRVE